MTLSLAFLEGELHPLSREVEQMPADPGATPSGWATRFNLLFDLNTLLAVLHVHPDMDDAARHAALTAQQDVAARLAHADLGYHRQVAATSPPPADPGDPGRRVYLVTHMCPALDLHELPCATFATLDHALAATGHDDPAHWTSDGDDRRQVVLTRDHRRTWLPATPWRIQTLRAADLLRPGALTENPAGLTATAARARH